MKSFKEFLNEAKYKSMKSASQLKVGDVVLYGNDDTPHEVVSKPEKDIMGHWIKLKNLATKKDVKAWLDADDKIPMNEAVVHNSNNKLQLKAGGSEILITTKGNSVNIFVQKGSERIMFEGKSDDLNAIKDFFSNI
jgi:translation elongation factor P/translation initiation factor 5A